MNRWKMHKLGFVNFWLYDREEFTLHDGHILLRGNNASGKSITTQSFIPFLLDGNKSPERLDPFGSRDRKMEYYLLGDGQRDENTGYLYLEFVRPDSLEYRTIGIGLRAVKGKPMEFWGFCLADGRRVGTPEFCLWEEVGRQLLPLTKQKLRNLLHDDNNWADSPKQYKQLVNDRLFQFRDLRQYDQLIQLLIKVRTPKLSKDAFRPTEVTRLLRDSLQVLTDDDLSAMVSAMEDMDRLEEQLRQQRDSYQEGMRIRREYDRYNQYMLGHKGRFALESHAALTRLEGEQKKIETEWKMLEQQSQEQRQIGQEAQALLQQAKVQYAALGEDDLAVQQQTLETEQQSYAQQKARLEESERRLSKTKGLIDQQEVQLRQKERTCQEAQDRMLASIVALEEENDVAALGDAHSLFLTEIRSGGGAGGESILRGVLQRRKQSIAQMLDLLTRWSLAIEEYDRACTQLDEAQTKLRQQRASLRDCQLQEQEERDTILEHFARCQSQYTAFTLTGEEMQTIRQQLLRYQIPADWTPIRELLDHTFQRHQQPIWEDKTHTTLHLEQLAKERSTLQTQLERLQRQPEPTPPRRPSVDAMRIQLTMRGIPHAPLYEAVDFAPHLTEEEQRILEEQLLDTGLLDALLIPPDSREALADLLELYPDRFLLPGEPVAHPITGLVPDSSCPFSDLVQGVLCAISEADLEAPLALLPDGRFRFGLLHGRCHGEAAVCYVGAAARRANHQRQMAQVQREIAQVEGAMEQDRTHLNQLEERLKLLRDEREGLPSPVDLDQAIALLRQAEDAVAVTEQLVSQRTQQEQSAKQLASRLEQQCRENSRDLPYERTVDAYEEARDSVAAYESQFQQVVSFRMEVAYARDGVQRIQTYLEQLYDQASDHKKDIGNLQKQLDVIRARMEAIEEVLSRPENRARAQRRTALQQEIERQQARQQQSQLELTRLDGEQRHLLEKQRQQAAQLEQLRQQTEQLISYFQEEQQLCLCHCEGADWKVCARHAWGNVRESDQNRSRERLEDALKDSYQQHNNKLLQYRPNMELLFDDAAQAGQLRQRYAITLQWNGRTLSLNAFLSSLKEQMDLTTTVMEEKDRELFESILTETISLKLRNRIAESQQWTHDMTALMATLKTSMGLTFRLDWKPKRAEGENQLDTAPLVELLNRDRALLTREDSQRLSTHFRTRVRAAREEMLLQGQSVVYGDLIRKVLDYRDWYEFLFQYQREGDSRKELTDRTFNKFSGGEKAMAMYVPLFAAVYAQYDKGGSDSPRILALDEAFAGVDEQNISAMFQLVQKLDFDYIMNSQALWGCYDTVKDLDIAELHRPSNSSVITILRYHWNGARRMEEETP